MQPLTGCRGKGLTAEFGVSSNHFHDPVPFYLLSSLERNNPSISIDIKCSAGACICCRLVNIERDRIASPRSELKGLAPLAERNPPDLLSLLPVSTSPSRFHRHCLHPLLPRVASGGIFVFLSPTRRRSPAARRRVYPVREPKVPTIWLWHVLADRQCLACYLFEFVGRLTGLPPLSIWSSIRQK